MLNQTTTSSEVTIFDELIDKPDRILAKVSSPVPFADINLIRFNGSRINGLSLMALRQVGKVYKIALSKPRHVEK